MIRELLEDLFGSWLGWALLLFTLILIVLVLYALSHSEGSVAAEINRALSCGLHPEWVSCR